MAFMKNNYLYFIIGLTVTAFISIFVFETFNYKLIADDEWFRDLLSEKGIINATVYTYVNVNGRWFSHLWDCIIFKLFLHRYNLLFMYHFFLLVFFILALSQFIITVFQKQYSIVISYLKSVLISICLTAFFFFFYFEGRVEVWYWVTATGVHLLSLIALLILITYCIKSNLRPIENSLVLISAVAIGGMSESYALMSLVILLFGGYKQFIPLKKSLFIIILIIVSLLVNILSGGLQSRLSALPDFNLVLALRNTIHSLLLPFINYRYLPLKIGVLVITFLFAEKIGKLKNIGRGKFVFGHFFKQLIVVISIITLSFFIPCFLLTDIIAYRMASFGYLFFLLFVFNYFMQYGSGNTKV